MVRIHPGPHMEIETLKNLSSESLLRQIAILPSFAPDGSRLIVASTTRDMATMTLEEIRLDDKNCQVIAVLKSNGKVKTYPVYLCIESQMYDYPQQVLTDLETLLRSNGIEFEVEL